MAREEKQYEGLLQSTIGVMFMGTPHDGADAAQLASTAAGIANSLLMQKLNTIQLETLKSGSEKLRDISRSFGHLENFKIVTVLESNETPIPYSGTSKLVSKYSTYLTFESTLTGQDCRSCLCSPQPWESRKSRQHFGG